MKLLVCGGRAYPNRAFVWRVLDCVHASEGPVTALVHGAAGGLDKLGRLVGADKLAGEWADEARVEQRPYPAAWKSLGKSAGPIRNQNMLDAEKPDLVLAFPGGRGTADMMKRAKDAGVRVVEAGYYGGDARGRLVGPP